MSEPNFEPIKNCPQCEDCLNRTPVISENGMHYNCSLPEDKTMECLFGVEDHSISVSKLKELNNE